VSESAVVQSALETLTAEQECHGEEWDEWYEEHRRHGVGVPGRSGAEPRLRKI